MEGKINWGKLEATFTVTDIDLLFIGGAASMVSMATLLVGAFLG